MISVNLMSFDLDRYYTPERVARQALEGASLDGLPEICVDSACGIGRLLDAVSNVFGKVQCAGLDRDKRAIASLRRKNPHWNLAVGDLLKKTRKDRLFTKLMPVVTDLLVLNPPFSHGASKNIGIVYDGRELRVSVAMAHILRSVELFHPRQGAIAIVPESLLYSETDSTARALLAEKYNFKKLRNLSSSTFQGARANASVIQMTPGASLKKDALHLAKLKQIGVKIIRGGLPVYQMEQSSRGTRYVHSTDLRKIARGDPASKFTKTAGVAKGIVSGWAVLIPRVGRPDRLAIVAVNIAVPIQLSDCVICIECRNSQAAMDVELRIKSSWSEFFDLYKGTGARYITIGRLRDWLRTKAIVESL